MAGLALEDLQREARESEQAPRLGEGPPPRDAQESYRHQREKIGLAPPNGGPPFGVIVLISYILVGSAGGQGHASASIHLTIWADPYISSNFHKGVESC